METKMVILRNIILFSCFLGLLAKESPKNNRPSKLGNRINDEFNPDNISVSVSTDYISDINLSALSYTNSPDEYLELYFKVAQTVNISGLPTQEGLNLEITKRESPYDKTPFTNRNYTSVQSTGSESVSITLNVYESLNRNVDFSDLTISSTIEYNVTILTETIISWNDETNFNTATLLNEDTRISLQDDAMINLASHEGQDLSQCDNQRCSSTTFNSKVMDGFDLNDGIEVFRITTVSPKLFSERKTVDKNNTYHMVNSVLISYFIQIGKVF
ncbi:uncharacterized protein LOC126884499 [Diabrotica virgifera virgifera]|uniref:Uncharacterized protein LOC114346816 n=1 Tax=Diabrotica virgifera virgifera TaxID=50390 RepID=A0A6P7GV17_DIAVI|nr:uncharacterized protein LOC126884499 [Diabrotica virgifera virgifera]